MQKCVMVATPNIYCSVMWFAVPCKKKCSICRVAQPCDGCYLVYNFIRSMAQNHFQYTYIESMWLIFVILTAEYLHILPLLDFYLCPWVSSRIFFITGFLGLSSEALVIYLLCTVHLPTKKREKTLLDSKIEGFANKIPNKYELADKTTKNFS